MRIFLLVVVLVSQLSFIAIARAHPVLPKEVMEFIWENPRASDADIDAWLTQNPQFDVEDTRGMMSMLRDLTDQELQNLQASTSTDTDTVTDQTNIPLWKQIYLFIWQGIHHIVIGTDHILFVLSLLLVPITLRRLLVVITTFTVAHSITLIAAGTGFIFVPGHITESIIAFSIIYSAFTSVFLYSSKQFSILNRIATVFVFGLFHGLGFASVFTDLELTASKFLVPLLSFNLGIEIGQICVIVIAYPIVQSMQRSPHAKTMTKIAAIGMIVVASIWLWQRLFT